jgi:hypothetical protein
MGEIWTVKGRDRERVSAAERAVVTQQRRKLLGKSMPRQPTLVRAHRTRSAQQCSLRANCSHPRIAPLSATALMARTHSPMQLFRKTTLKFPLDKTVGQHHFCWRNPVIFITPRTVGDCPQN